jgi:uncharacterized membrane protein YfcA
VPTAVIVLGVSILGVLLGVWYREWIVAAVFLAFCVASFAKIVRDRRERDKRKPPEE